MIAYIAGSGGRLASVGAVAGAFGLALLVGGLVLRWPLTVPWSILIVGGGTAGWLTAAYLAKHLVLSERSHLEVTVLESPDIGVIGVGEPPIVSTAAAISNAVFNAIGARVPVLPLTPKNVLDALVPKGGKA